MMSEQHQGYFCLNHNRTNNNTINSSNSSRTMLSAEKDILVAALNNNKATREIQHGHYTAAYELLASALDSMKKYIQLQPSLEERSMKENGNGNSSNKEKMICYHSLCTFSSSEGGHETTTASSSFVDNDSSSMFVFQRPIQMNLEAIAMMISSEEDEEDDDDAMITDSAFHSKSNSSTRACLDCSEFCTFAIIYNLALCKHLQGVTSTSPYHKNHLLKKAMAFYDHATRLLATCMSVVAAAQQRLHSDFSFPGAAATTTTTSGSSMSRLYLIAVLNNLGHIHTYFQSSREARSCLQRMANAMAIYERQQEKLDDGFASNVMLLLLTESAAAAA